MTIIKTIGQQQLEQILSIGSEQELLQHCLLFLFCLVIVCFIFLHITKLKVDIQKKKKWWLPSFYSGSLSYICTTYVTLSQNKLCHIGSFLFDDEDDDDKNKTKEMLFS